MTNVCTPRHRRHRSNRKRPPFPRVVPCLGLQRGLRQNAQDGVYVYGGYFVSLRSTTQSEGAYLPFRADHAWCGIGSFWVSPSTSVRPSNTTQF